MKNTESDEATGPLDNMVKSSPFQGGVSGSLPERATLTNELKSIMISTYRKYGDEKALLIKGKRSYTGKEIAEAIENETEFGIEMIGSLLKLTIDLLKRDKINISR